MFAEVEESKLAIANNSQTVEDNSEVADISEAADNSKMADISEAHCEEVPRHRTKVAKTSPRLPSTA